MSQYVNLTDFVTDRAGLPYQSSLDHLEELMIRQKLFVHLCILQFRKRFQLNANDCVPGYIAITDNEIDYYLVNYSPLISTDQNLSGVEKTIHDNIELIEFCIHQRVEKSLQSGLSLPCICLSRIFGLSQIETDIILTCLAPEIDQQFERLYGYLQDDMTSKRPSAGLVININSELHKNGQFSRKYFLPDAPLMKYRILSISDDRNTEIPFLSRRLNIDDRIVSFLLSESGYDKRISSYIDIKYPEQLSISEQCFSSDQLQLMSSSLNNCIDNNKLIKKAIFYLSGKDHGFKSLYAALICKRLNLPMLSIDFNRAQSTGINIEDLLFFVFRESLLLQTLVYIPDISHLSAQDMKFERIKFLLQLIDKMVSLAILCGEQQWSWTLPGEQFQFITVEFSKPEFEQQLFVWKKALGMNANFSEKSIMTLISKYSLSPEKIEVTVKTAITSAISKNKTLSVEMIDQACRMQNIPELGSYAQRIEPKHSWQDLILPEEQLKQLHDICNQVTNKALVFGKWGFNRTMTLGSGLHALFSGPPGTGKTLAAEILANELNLDLFKVDLSQIVSKYIGETEKNLNNIFSQAQQGNAILLFDEADALLGKRSEVKDAHDRYANLEIAYLLQKMEEYEGASILTTNFRQNMDDAFTRRIRFIVEFPFPEEEYRYQLWQGIWPDQTPVMDDVDFMVLAKKFRLSGGNIRNIALTAAFLAAANGNTIEMKHLLAATKEEFKKMGRLINEKEYAIAS